MAPIRSTRIARRHRWGTPDSRPRRTAARLVLLVVCMGLALSVARAQPVSAGPCDPPIANPIVCENSKPGNPASEWDVSGGGSADIQGYAADISVNKGETVRFKVKTSSTDYRLDIYRIGYYGGMGARKIATVAPSVALPQTQPSCLTDGSVGLIDCGNWAVSASWPVPSDAVSGIYIAKLVREDGTSGSSHIIFIVRDDSSASDLLFQTSDTTWQAYNDYGGASLYKDTVFGLPRAYKVSYNRPFATRGIGGGASFSQFFSAEYPMVRWLEANGYHVSYTSGVDSDRRGAEIREHRVFLSVGHDEYWSAGQRSNVEAARTAGVSLAFFSGNEVFWKTRWEASIDGSSTPHRTLVCFKETSANAKIDPDPAWTGTWRDPRFSPPADGGRPENALTGTIFMVNGTRNDAITVPADDGKMRFWRNTNVATLAPGATATLPAGTLGYEWDEDLDNGFRPAGAFRLSTTTLDVTPKYLQDYGSTYGSGVASHSLVLYRHSSGALVFGAGTVQWSWGLDATHDNPGTPADTRMQQATVNLLADMRVQPGTLQAGLVAATASTDATAPTSMITSPSGGATVTAGVGVTINGSAADTGGAVGGVEVSVDGGTTWRRANGRASWSYSWMPTGIGSVTLKSRAVDDSGNIESPSAGVTVTVAPNPTVTFDDLTGQNQPLNGSYPSGVIAWGTGAWWHAGPFGGLSTKNLSFNGSTTLNATFTFLLPRQLIRLDAYNGGNDASTVTLSCAGQPSRQVSVARNQLLTIETGWTGTCTNVTIASTNGWNTNFDNLYHLAGTPPESTPPVISAVQATNVSSGRATISWNTDETADSQVEYGTSTTYASTTPIGTALVTDHAVTLSGLTASTTYHYRVKSRDAAGNLAVSGDFTFTTLDPSAGPLTVTFDDLGGQDQVLNGQYPSGVIDWGSNQWYHSAPYGRLSTKNVTFNGASVKSATLTFVTPQLLQSLDAYNGGGATTVTLSCAGQPNKQFALATGELATVLTGWGGTCTAVTIASTNGWDTNFDNLVIDTAAPAIANVQATAITMSGATITWTTNEPSDSQVEYGTTTAYGASTPLDGSLVTNHSMTLSGLQPGTTYHYRVKSRDVLGNLVTSLDFSFTTAPAPDTTPPVISAVQAANLSSSGATVTWTTDEPATSQVEYGTTTAYGATTPLDSALVTSHTVALGGLLPNTTYHYRVLSRDAAGNPAASADFTFTTPAPPDTTPPVINGVQTSNITSTAATIVWTTDEPADTQVEYGATTAYGATTPLDSALVTSHTVALGGLLPNTTYHYRVKSKDAGGNLATSTNFTFTTKEKGCPCMIWSDSATPATPSASDSQAIELGVKFRAEVDGYITALRFYKGSANTGTHVANLWSSSGTLLASATFTNESASGWQEVKLAAPVRVSANTTYVASYHAPNGGYAVSRFFFSTSTIDSPPLHALQDGIDGGNGVYRYGPTGFPTSTYQSTNYWVDVVFDTVGTDTVAPAISGVQAGSVTSTGAAISWTTNEPADSQIEYGTTAAYGSTTPLDPAMVTSHQVTLSNLLPSTTYHYRVKSKDAAGNPATSSDLTFTTPAPPDTTAPAISAVQAANLSSSGATVTWATDEPATSQVEYGTTTAYGATTPLDSALVTSHTVALGGLLPNTTYHYRVLSRDAAGNLSASPGFSFTTNARSCPCSIWKPADTPAVASTTDTRAVELGVKFRAEVDGYITALRFYKGSANTGTHVANLWSSSGTLLASATFTNESASGWQEVKLAAPVRVSANTTYVASYHAPNGGYAVTSSYFATTGVDYPPLRALANGADGGNGVYKYSSTSAFPTSTYQAANYWVDVVFDLEGRDTVAPSVVAQVPVRNATNVPITATASVVFSESVAAPSISFVLRDGAGASIAGTTSYDDVTRTATFDPTAPLAGGATFTVTVSEARDPAGNVMAPVSWSFTTGSCPCSIWKPADTPAVASTTDTRAVELGVKFRAEVDGYITALRFYKGSANTGTHVANLWSSSGTLLASATFTNESASGWQEVKLAAPVRVSANTTYVASYHAPNGGYARNLDYFATTGTDSPPLHALKNGIDGGNGVYKYGPSGFPIYTSRSTNYWVDVVFTTSTEATGAPVRSGAGSQRPAGQVDAINPGGPFPLGGASSAAGRTPRMITEVRVVDITSTSATVTWITAEPADSQVEYGLTDEYGLASPVETRRVTSHSVRLTGLSPNTTYEFRVLSVDGAGVPAESGNLTFSTTGATGQGPPVQPGRR